MCGRFVATTQPEQLALLFEAVLDDPFSDGFQPNYNVAPTTGVLMVTQSAAAEPRLVRRARWGLIPPWSKDETRASSMINARSETLTQKPSFRNLVDRNRCIIPVDGYYEWQTVGVSPGSRTPKQPYYVRASDERPLPLAGVWTTWRHPATNVVVTTCAIITTQANARLSTVHDRMPCVLNWTQVGVWLTNETLPADMLQSADVDRLTAVTVSTAVNSVRNRGPALIEPTVTTLF